MPKRFAGSRLEQVFTPIKDRVKTTDSPYYYGMDESQWRAFADQYQKELKRGAKSVEQIQQDLNVGPKEAQLVLSYANSPQNYNDVMRHVAMGTPHATASEELAREALIASRQPAAFMNDDNPFATDLKLYMPDGSELQADVQQRLSTIMVTIEIRSQP